MNEKNVKVRFKHKYDTEENWKLKNPILFKGELAIVELPDKSLKIKCGNGTDAFNDLDYIQSEATIGEYGDIYTTGDVTIEGGIFKSISNHEGENYLSIDPKNGNIELYKSWRLDFYDDGVEVGNILLDSNEGKSHMLFNAQNIEFDGKVDFYNNVYSSKNITSNEALFSGGKIYFDDNIPGGCLNNNGFLYLTSDTDQNAGINIYRSKSIIPTHQIIAKQNEFYMNTSLNVNGNLKVVNQIIHEARGTDGESGYVHFATLKILSQYCNKPLAIEVCRRGDREATTLYIQFASGATTDPSLQSFIATGNRNCKNVFYMYKASSGVWHLFGQKSEGWDSISVYRANNPYYNGSISVEFTDTFYTSVPNGYIQATLYNFYTATEVNSFLSNKQNSLGFTPIRQGGGSGQLSNTVYIGWSGSRLKAQVDATDLGNIVFDGRLSSYIATQRFDLKTGATAGNATGQVTYTITKSGYTPIGIVSIQSYGTRSSLINIYNYSVSGNQAFVLYRNIGSNALAANDTGIRIVVLYKQN